MSRTARLWKGVGPLTLGGVLLRRASGRCRRRPALEAADRPPGGRRLAQGRTAEARAILEKRPEARPDQCRSPRGPRAGRPAVRLVATRTPSPRPAPAVLARAPAPAARRPTLGRAVEARGCPPPGVLTGDPPAAPAGPRPDQQRPPRGGPVRAADDPQRRPVGRPGPRGRSASGSRTRSARRSARPRPSRSVSRSSGPSRIDDQAADDARLRRRLRGSSRNQETVGVLMAEFDNLMAEGTFIVLSNAGTGDIDATTAPFTDARAAPSPPGPSTPTCWPPTPRSSGPDRPVPRPVARLRGTHANSASLLT